MSISRATLEEEVYLRGLTGFLIGENLYEGYSKIAIITVADRICCSVVSAQIAGYMHRYGYGKGSFKVFFYEDGKAEKIVDEVLAMKPEAISIMLGGEQKMSFVSSATHELIKTLSKKKSNIPIIFHVRVFLATKQLSTLLADKEIASYLSSIPEIRVFTADLNAKKFLYSRIKVSESKALLFKFAESTLTEEHVELLKRSLPPPE